MLSVVLLDVIVPSVVAPIKAGLFSPPATLMKSSPVAL